MAAGCGALGEGVVDHPALLFLANTYKYKGACPDNQSQADDWGFRQCDDTSYVADILNQSGISFTHRCHAVSWGESESWWFTAQRVRASSPEARVTTPTIPSAGDVAWWRNHVAYVVHAYPDDFVDVCEYDWDKNHDFGCRFHVKAEGYIRFDRPSFTNGNMLNSPPESSPLDNTTWIPRAVEPCQTREAENYWGMSGIDWAGNWVSSPGPVEESAEGSEAGNCTAGLIHIAGWHRGDLVEYRVFFPDAGAYVLNAIGLPGNPPPIFVNVYVDTVLAGTITWKDGPPECNVPDAGSSQRIKLAGYHGAHAVAFEFADDDDRGTGWCNREFLFDRFSMELPESVPGPCRCATARK